MKVADLIQSRREVYSITEDATVYDAARYLREKQVRAVGVRDAHGKLVGVISQADMSDKVAAENKCPAWMRVSEIMNRGLITVNPEISLEECLRLMDKHNIYHLLVVEEKKGDYLGMVSVRDLLRLIASDEKERADLFQALLFPER